MLEVLVLRSTSVLYIKPKNFACYEHKFLRQLLVMIISFDFMSTIWLHLSCSIPAFHDKDICHM